MSVFPLPERGPFAGQPPRRLGAALRRWMGEAAAGARRTAALVAGVVCELVSQVLAWFKADPRRIRVALTGVVACTAIGVLIGLVSGYAMARLALLGVGLVQGLVGV